MSRLGRLVRAAAHGWRRGVREADERAERIRRERELARSIRQVFAEMSWSRPRIEFEREEQDQRD